jgi:hypothetical protein
MRVARDPRDSEAEIYTPQLSVWEWLSLYGVTCDITPQIGEGFWDPLISYIYTDENGNKYYFETQKSSTSQGNFHRISRFCLSIVTIQSKSQIDFLLPGEILDEWVTYAILGS